MSESVGRYIEIVKDLKDVFERDYEEFVRDRKRWKTDFDIASKKAKDNFIDIQSMLKDCVE